MSDVLCNDCLDTGWQWDREGRTPCNCVSETEPYQMLKEENERLAKLASQRGARMQIMRDYMAKQRGLGPPTEWDYFAEDMDGEPYKWFDADGVPVEDAAMAREGG